MTEPLAARIDSRLRSLQEAGLVRTLRPPSGLDLSSNDYLGLARDPRVVEAFMAGAKWGGCGSTGSRLLRGDRLVFRDVERRFAAFKGAQRAVYFSSGYLANLAVLTTLAEKGDVIVSDERNHASLIDAARLSRAERVIVAHQDVDAVGRCLERRSRLAGSQHTFVVVESVFSMDGDRAPLADYASLCRAHGATLVVDEAHAVGLYGARGSGALEEAGLDPDSCISVNSAGKALGVAGAFVAGPDWVAEYLIQRARPFVFSTAPPPAVAEAIQESLRIVEREPERRRQVLEHATTARRSLLSAGINVPLDRTPIVPILVGDNARALRIAELMQEQGFDIRAIRPPTVPEGTARLRLSVNWSLSMGAIESFVHALAGALEAATPWPAASL